MPTGAIQYLVDAKGNVTTVSPQGNVYMNEAFPYVMRSFHMSMTAGSGGTNLPNVPCGKIELQNLSGNHVMWIGGVGIHAPSSGRGNEFFPMSVLFQGEKIIYLNNANQLSICAQVSGELISFIAYGNGSSTVIDPATQGSQPNEQQPSAPSWS